MLRNAALTIALVLLPAIASAQEHSHTDAAKKAHHDHAAVQAGGHVDFAQVLMKNKAELKLTEEQITKLEDLSAKMTKHHAEMMKSGAKPVEHTADSKLHEELMAIFTEEQRAKIHPLMKQHMEGVCAKSEDKQCKMDAHKKMEIQ
jgi:hypothetical protein